MIDSDYKYDPEEHFDPTDEKREDSIVRIREKKTEDEDDNDDKEPATGKGEDVEDSQVGSMSYRDWITLARRRLRKDCHLSLLASNWIAWNVCPICNFWCDPKPDKNNRYYCQALSDELTRVWLYESEFMVMPDAGIVLACDYIRTRGTLREFFAERDRCRIQAKTPDALAKAAILRRIIIYQQYGIVYEDPYGYTHIDRTMPFDASVSQSELHRMFSRGDRRMLKLEDPKTLRRHLRDLERQDLIVKKNMGRNTYGYNTSQRVWGVYWRYDKEIDLEARDRRWLLEDEAREERECKARYKDPEFVRTLKEILYWKRRWVRAEIRGACLLKSFDVMEARLLKNFDETVNEAIA